MVSDIDVLDLHVVVVVDGQLECGLVIAEEHGQCE
jgi:hypothetical protein